MSDNRAKKFSTLRDKIKRDPARKRRIEMMGAVNELIRAAFVVEDYCHEGEISHLPGCATGYPRGVCTCGLPELAEAITSYDKVHGLVNSSRE